MPTQLPTHCGDYTLRPKISEQYAKDPQIGTVFGRLTTTSEVIAERYTSGRAVKKIIVRCTCGGVKKVNKDALISGFTLSCGCLSKEAAAESGKMRRTHYASKTSEYMIWASMVQRCRNSKAKAYHFYGGKGIDVCDAWLKFENFIADMGTKPFIKASLERVDNQKGYEPGNVIWADQEAQANNKCSSVRVLYNEKLWTLKELAEISVVSLGTLRSRIYQHKWTPEQAVTTPVGCSRPDRNLKLEIPATQPLYMPSITPPATHHPTT